MCIRPTALVTPSLRLLSNARAPLLRLCLCACTMLRSSALLPAFDDLLLTVGLEQRGVSAHPVEDLGAMLRCLNAAALAERLDVSLLPDEGNDAFLARILPHDSLVFWPADRW